MTAPLSREAAIQARDRLDRAHGMSASRVDSTSLYSEGRDAIAYLLAENEKLQARIDKARELLRIIDAADRDILNGRPEMDAADEKEVALSLLRAALTNEGDND